MSVDVSRFTILSSNFAICCYGLIQIFCAKHGFTLATSATILCSLRGFASILRFVGTSSLTDFQEELADASLNSGILSSSWFSMNSFTNLVTQMTILNVLTHCPSDWVKQQISLCLLTHILISHCCDTSCRICIVLRYRCRRYRCSRAGRTSRHGTKSDTQFVV